MSTDVPVGARRAALVACLAGTLCACGSRPGAQAGAEGDEPVGVAKSPVIYGEDGRVELVDLDDGPLRDVAAARVVALMPSDAIVVHGDSVQLVAPTLGSADNLCPGERFADQPSAAVCSGILLDSQTVLTAGHCMRAVSCDDVAFVFGYAIGPNGAPPVLHAKDVYGCKEVLVRDDSQAADGEQVDFSWVRLDRPVPTLAPDVVFRPASEALQMGEAVTVVGFGGGTPMKVDQGGRVADPRPREKDYFTSTSDTFHGDSGGPVFDSQARLVGIEVRGRPDYVASPAGCNVASRLVDAPTVAGEESTYAARALEGLCGDAAGTESLCPATRHEGDFVGRGRAGCTLAAGGRAGGTSYACLWLLAASIVARRRSLTLR